MNIVLSAETQKLLEERMKKGGFATPDDALRDALETLDQLSVSDEPLDSSALDAIEEGMRDCERGECRTLDEVRREFQSRGLCK